MAFLRVLGVGCWVLVAGCVQDPRPKTQDRQFGVDDFGDTISLATAPQRIVSLNPTTTEILFALGADKLLVGRSDWDNYPPAARAIPALGPAIRPNVEAIIQAQPELVLLYASSDNRAAAQRLRAAGINTVSLKIDSIAEFDRATRLLGRILRDSTRGALVADTVKRTLDSVRAAMAGLPRVTVVMPAWHEPLMVIGGGSFVSQLIEIAGGQNVYADIDAPSPPVTFEDILKRNPRFVLVGPQSADRIKAMAQWRALPAVREGRLLVIDTNVTLRPATRLGEGAVSLARLLHPGGK